jgi:hypothetical protein
MLLMLDFSAVVAEAQDRGRVHALLGNGFSRACRDNIFAYGALFERADFASLSPAARAAFDTLGTRDFEVVIDGLRRGHKLIGLYDQSNDIRARMVADADGLREVLVSAIATSHPDYPGSITDAQYAACRRFLATFDRVYTLNYELLLYWAGMNSTSDVQLKFDDGFRNADEPDVDYVVWDPAASNRDQNIFYVHGGLHLFDAGAELTKYTWKRTGVRLIDQVRAALADEKYPLFVAEGQSAEKLARIRHHSYLGRIERSFLEIQGALVAHGVSFSENDQHVMDWIARGKLSKMYVGVFGDPDSDSNRALIARAQALSASRTSTGPKGKALDIEFFHAASARAWG